MLRLSLSFGLGGGEKERIHNNCIQSLHVILKSEKITAISPVTFFTLAIN